ncbi:MAG: phosphatidylserine decarboxylase [Planctomycetota bacterium]|jgi:phosphatidylserine decarboxylase|nr:phosphatidylserine decarboxylase [Planctomycetota bacterium]
MTFVRWGIPPLLISTVMFIWAVSLLPAGPARLAGIGVCALLWLFIVNFFRNPNRTPEGDARTVIAAADGVIADITEVDQAEFIDGPAVRIGIFLNVFDVHVNRSPIEGTVAFARYEPGRFLDARHPDVSHENESNTLGIEVRAAVCPDQRILLRQLSGLIARRIVCTHGVGDELGRGEMYGMIKFGSRTEIWLPKGRHRLLVAVGQRVRCGETAMAELLAPGELP